MIRVLLVDDHRASREPLALVLNNEPDLVVVAQVGSEAEVHMVLRSGQRVDLAIVEVELGDEKGLQVIEDLCSHNANIQILVLTGSTDKRIYGCALHAGASGILNKTVSPQDVITSIRRLVAGESLMSVPEAADLMARGEEYLREDTFIRASLARLTPRECEVLRGLVAGMSNEEIAQQLTVGHETVRSHVVKILKKLGASSRLHAAILALRHGFDPDLDAVTATHSTGPDNSPDLK